MKKFIALLAASAMLFAFAWGTSAETLKTGDIDGNGKITAGDARLVLRAAAQLEKLSDEQLALAEVTGDGKITAADARVILRAAAQLESFTEAPETTTEPATEGTEEPASQTTEPISEITTEDLSETMTEPDSETAAEEAETATENNSDAKETERIITAKDFPEQLKILNGDRCTFYAYSHTIDPNQLVTIACSGTIYKATMTMDIAGEYTAISLLTKEEDTIFGKNTTNYIICEDTKRYAILTDYDIWSLGLNPEDFNLSILSEEDPEKISAVVGTEKIMDTTYTTYRIDSEMGYCVFYLLDDEIKYIDSFDTNGYLIEAWDIVSVSDSVDDSVFSLDGYTRSYSLFGIFDFGIFF